MSEPTQILEGWIDTEAPWDTDPLVAVLSGAVVVAKQNIAEGTFLINGGGETLVYAYDTSKVDVMLTGIGTSHGRIHLLYNYWDVDDYSYGHTIVTFDATAISP